MLSRRAFIWNSASGCFAAAHPLLTATGAGAATGTSTLGALAAAKGLTLGASFAVHELDQPYGAEYGALYKTDVKTITSELELKMASIRPSPDVIEFGPADRLVAYAEQNGLGVRGHTLIWNDYLPDWILQLGTKDAARLLEAHLETVLQRYQGRVAVWDVVNEPIAPWHQLPGNLRDGVFLKALGESYIDKSFRIARAIAPAAKLALNEAQTETADENGQTFRDSFLRLVRRLRDDGVPLDVIGLQCHLDSRKPYDFPRFVDFLQQLAALGLELHITELDVNDWAFPSNTSQRDVAVANLYAKFLAAVLPVKALTSITLWQLADHTSWLNEWNRNEAKRLGRKARAPRPLPYSSEFKKKPAWGAIAAALENAPPR